MSAAILVLATSDVSAQVVADPVAVRAAAKASGLDSLATVPDPEVKGLGRIVKPGPAAREALVRLGKAMFWDMQAGSDGQSCGSCHFHAGADNRARNQESPGLRAVPEDTFFGNNFLGVPGFPQFGPDDTLQAANFPLHKLQDPEQNNFFLRVVLKDTNDVVSSMGVFPAFFVGVVAGQSSDVGTPFVDPTYNKNTPSAFDIGKNVRRVEPRNTPTVINALFNHSNFWDGRAHNTFNGVSVIGPLDPGAMVWVAGAGGSLSQETVATSNSSLASQAVGPPTSDLEMSFFNRPFPMVGRKLLSLTPLGLQVVDPTDSVLGSLSNFPGKGIGTTYAALIQAAFQDRFWNSDQKTPAGFTVMEANFTLFWGLAVQAYEFLLRADRAPFDLFMEGDDTALTAVQLQGLLVFLNRGARGNFPEVDAAIAALQAANPGVVVGAGNCVSCHGSPAISDATFPALAENNKLELIEIENTTQLAGGLLAVNTAVQGLLDNGFSNIGVRPINDDLGRGGKEGGFPLAFSRQLFENPDLLKGVLAGPPPCMAGSTCPTELLVDGAFKIPSVRNAELTGPFFHNGGQATLGQVVEFYDRQGDFGDVNIRELDRNLVFIDLGEQDEEPLVGFIIGLTDPRVRNEMQPFDHPQLIVPDGGTFASPRTIEIPGVGAGGRPAKGLPPLLPFLGLEQ